jgi:pimeloyl-ACP methyl ester carboxylesterase
MRFRWRGRRRTGAWLAVLIFAMTWVAPLPAGAAIRTVTSPAGPGACLAGQTSLAQVTAGGQAGPVTGSVPVIFVHGIVSSPAMWKTDTPGSLTWQAAAMKGLTAWTFNYARYAEDWVTNSAIGPALASAIGCLAHASGHQVIVVAHSMGGLATQYAVGMAGSAAAGHVAGVVTVGTPYTGSQVLSDMQAAVNGAEVTGGVSEDGDIAAVAEALLSACAGIATHTADNPCLLASVLRAPIGTALEVNSPEIRALPPWPSSLPVLDVGGNMDLFLGVGLIGIHTHPGDIAVTLPSATAHDTAGAPFVLACSTSFLKLVRQLALPSCFHSDLVNDKPVINRILKQIRKYQAEVTSPEPPCVPQEFLPKAGNGEKWTMLHYACLDGYALAVAETTFTSPGSSPPEDGVATFRAVGNQWVVYGGWDDGTCLLGTAAICGGLARAPGTEPPHEILVQLVHLAGLSITSNGADIQ